MAWSAWERPGLNGVLLGAATQKVLGSKGDFVNLDWGHLHLASPLVGLSCRPLSGRS